jgi:hypothetical protein
MKRVHNSESHQQQLVEASDSAYNRPRPLVNPADGSRGIFQVQPSRSALNKVGLEQSTNCRWWDSSLARRLVCRLDLNHPPTSVGGILAQASIVLGSPKRLAVWVICVILFCLSMLNRTKQDWYRCHDLASWSLTVAATTIRAAFEMPRPCVVESHVLCYRSHQHEPPRGKLVASSRRLRWFVATSVNLHEAGSWHPLRLSKVSPWSARSIFQVRPSRSALNQVGLERSTHSR